MNIKKEKYIIKIPNNALLVYCEKKNILVIKGFLLEKSLKLKLKIFINKFKNLIKISRIYTNKIYGKIEKKVKSLKSTTKALIKNKLIEVNAVVYQKLKLNGIGYRVDNTRSDKLLTFKLGYSHLIYFKISLKLNIFYFNKTKICIFGHSYQNVKQICSLIRLIKKPESYKAKGIQNENEKIILKEGKKI